MAWAMVSVADAGGLHSRPHSSSCPAAEPGIHAVTVDPDAPAPSTDRLRPQSLSSRTAMASTSISQPGLARPATWNTERAGRFGCASVPKNSV